MVDPQGYRFAIASGVSNGKGYFADAETIYRFLRQKGLKWLYEECPPQIPLGEIGVRMQDR